LTPAPPSGGVVISGARAGEPHAEKGKDEFFFMLAA
jgi:hypothetical protein